MRPQPFVNPVVSPFPGKIKVYFSQGREEPVWIKSLPGTSIGKPETKAVEERPTMSCHLGGKDSTGVNELHRKGLPVFQGDLRGDRGRMKRPDDDRPPVGFILRVGPQDPVGVMVLSTDQAI
jgi:hypothetical protein